jgi:hypothetical protein
VTKFYESSQITEAWSRATATAIPTNNDAVKGYVKALAEEYSNGPVVYREFRLELDEQVFAMAAHYENWQFSQLLDLLWLVPGVAEQISRLGRIGSEVVEHFTPADVFELSSHLGRMLHQGGAYSTASKPVAPSIALGTACAQALMDGEDARAFTANTVWCQFFHDVAWDQSVVVVVPSRQRVKVLLATDTD